MRLFASAGRQTYRHNRSAADELAVYDYALSANQVEAC
jgi:hypothetical protein